MKPSAARRLAKRTSLCPGLRARSCWPGEKLVLVEVDLGGRGDVALDSGAQVERLAGFQPARHLDGGDEHLGLRRIVQRDGVDLDAVGGEACGGGSRGVCRVVAVAEQHDPARGLRGQHGVANSRARPMSVPARAASGVSGQRAASLAAFALAFARRRRSARNRARRRCRGRGGAACRPRQNGARLPGPPVRCWRNHRPGKRPPDRRRATASVPRPKPAGCIPAGSLVRECRRGVEPESARPANAAAPRRATARQRRRVPGTRDE